MQTQKLQERVTSQKDKLAELAKTVHSPQQECGRDNEAFEPQFTDSVNWNKGWGKYGKT